MAALTYLLDTNVLAEPVKPDPNRAVMARLRTFEFEIAVAAPSWHEMLFGVYRYPPGRRRQTLEHYLHHIVWPRLPVLAYDAIAAECHAKYRAMLGAIGKTPSFVDGQIAAIAIVNRLVLVTRNVSDFAAFPELSVLNWFD